TTLSRRHADDLTLDQAMEGIARSLNGVTWRRVYNRQAATSEIPAKDLVAALRTLDALPQNELRVDNLFSQSTITHRPNVAITESFLRELRTKQFASRPILVLYTRRVESDGRLSAEKRLAEVQRQQIALLLNMRSDQMAQIMTGEVEQVQN